ncbi:carbohydrate ABC transporter substrate-binding protein (CUT1 family) [Haloactinopolyspora alba]|uniref:Carbohydrate ABC transporter substrate-binding protein (CUT1 family) n=1 Tax=Haloactinopolyspora alba TaxID=648780 RepID=A0A2P8E282_9ACTN|nr:sugar ABC transporter substrate-binding protein [Haloactinopolyspora alba]PSL03584.1 carbohydrate ABC transporter substrate-binding protein (CUT1 family) [Haloactinopolyspora alba]
MAIHTPTRRDLLRWTGGGALAGLAAPLLGSCAGAPEEDSGSTSGGDDGGGSGGDFTVYWNAGHAYAAYDKVIAEFEEAHGVTVSFQKYQWDDLRTRLLSDFASGTVPDLVEEPGGWVQEFAISGDAVSLQQYVDSDGAEMGFPDDWQPRTISRNSYEGEVYGIQLHLTCMMLLYNRGMFDSAGVQPPTDWGSFLDVAEKLTGDGVHGFAMNQDDGYGWPWLLQNGVRYYDPDTKGLLVPHDAAAAALQFQADMAHKHGVSPVPTPGTDYSGPQKLLSAGRAAMIITGPWDLLPIAETSPDLDLGIAPALHEAEQSTVQAGTSLFVPAKAKSPDLAWDFIKRITALEVEVAATKEAGMLMPRLSWVQDPVVQENERYAAFAEGFAYAVDTSEKLRLTGKSGEINEQLFQTLYQDVVMNNTPATEALDRFLAAGQKVLAS